MQNQLHSTSRVHRLAAVWFANTVAFSRLSSENEPVALHHVDLLQEVARGVIEGFGGRLVKFMGDGVLADFGSTDVAVRAALTLQSEFTSRSRAAGLPTQLRIGVHVGDVVAAADGDIYGDGVNKAARLQSYARPGLVVVSEDVWRQLRQRPEFHFERIGERRLKGSGEPVRVFSVVLREEGVSHTPRTVRAALLRPWFVTGAAVLAALLLGMALYTWWESNRLRMGSRAELDSNLLAVAPFNVSAADPELRQWEEFFVDILARNLDGAGPLRTVPPSTAIRRWAGPADPASAAALGRRTGAGLVVFGSLIPSGRDSARVTAAILDVASDQILDEVAIEVRDPARRLVQLSDSLTVVLLRALGQTRPIGAVRHASLGSLTSVPALKAFLRGEQFYRRTAWDSAIAQYERAIEADSTFALALRRIGLALAWEGIATDSLSLAYLLRAGAHNRGLPPRESLLLLADSLSAAAHLTGRDPAYRAPEYWSYVRRLFATLEEATRRYPRDPEVWHALGEAGYHFGIGPAAVSERAMLYAFDRALALDSAFAPGYLHPIELGLKTGGWELGLRYIRPYLALDPTGVQAEAVRLLANLADPQAARAPQTQHLLDSASPDVLYAAFSLLDFWPDSRETALRLSELWTIRQREDPDWRERCSAYHPRLARRLAFRGRLQAAHCALGQDPPPSALLAEIALLGGIAADSASAMFDLWVQQGAAPVTFALPWLAERGDAARIRAFLERADSVGRTAPEAGERRRAAYDAATARAYLALVRGDTAEALERLTALPDTLCLNCFRLDRLVRARLLAAVGEFEAAEEILSAWRGWNVAPSDALFELERGRVAERLGKREAAIAAYRYVADAWANADPVLQPVAAEARAALARLTRENPTAGVVSPAPRRRGP